MIFLSQRPNNDPQPWVDVNGGRHVDDWATLRTFDPRPEFTQTRDPYSFICDGGETRSNVTVCTVEGWEHVWSPRHEEFDSPVNPILAAFRFTWDRDATHFLATSMISEIDKKRWDSYLAPEVQAHARRVLHLLAVISE